MRPTRTCTTACGAGSLGMDFRPTLADRSSTGHTGHSPRLWPRMNRVPFAVVLDGRLAHRLSVLTVRWRKQPVSASRRSARCASSRHLRDGDELAPLVQLELAWQGRRWRRSRRTLRARRCPGEEVDDPVRNCAGDDLRDPAIRAKSLTLTSCYSSDPEPESSQRSCSAPFTAF